MKKLLVSLLAIAGLVACTNDQTLVQRGNAPMEFAGAFVDNATRADKAADPSTKTEDLHGFDVWAFMDEPAGTVFVDEDVEGAQGNFTYANTQYWVPGHVYYFAALAPMNSANWNLNTAAANTDGAGIVDFHNVDGTEDLLYAATSVSTQNMELGAAMDKVKFQFNHLLSKVKFSFTNGFPNANARIDVKNVKMVAPAFASINLAQADWWSTNQWVLVEGETTTLKFGDACDKTAPGVTQETANERLTIPAGATQSYIVTFDVALYYGDRLAFEKTGITTTIDGVALEIGKSYNFTANLNASNIAGDTKLTSIDFDVEEVKKWEEKTVSLIDSPEKLVEAFEDPEVDHIILDGDIDLGDLFGASTLSTRAAATLPIVITESKVLDLNGYKITTPWDDEAAQKHHYAFENRGSLTIQDSKGNGQIIARGIFNYGTMTLKSGTINACDGNGGYGVRNYEGAEFIMNGGSIVTSYEDGDIPGEGYDASPVRVDEGATATINGGAINNVSNFTVAIDNYGTTTINDGTFTTIHTTIANSASMTINGGSFTCNGLEGVTAHALWAAAGTTTINGGTFNGKDNYNGFNVDASKGAIVNINGGKFLPVHSGSLYGDGTIIVKGGEFFDKIADKYVDYDYNVVKNGEFYTLERKADVAKIGEVGYTSLQKAVAAVQDGETITLVANETFTEKNYYDNSGWKDGLGYAGDKSFTIDLGGKTVSQNGALNDYLIWIKNVGSKANTITIKNGTLDAGTTAYCALCTASSHDNQLTINLEDVNLINNKYDGATVKVRTGSVLNVKAGTKITGKNSYLGIENWKATVNIYDGAEIYMNGTSSYNGCLVGVGGNGTINVYGGYGKGVSGGLIAMTSGGTINVSGGEWIANTDGTYANSNKSVLVAQSDKQYNAGAGNAIVNVTGGTFKGGYNCYGNAVGDAQINIKGGNFNANPSSYLAEGYEATEANGVWTVSYNPYYDHEKVANGLYKKDKTYVAINGEGLVALSGMTIKGGEIVTLGADIDLTGVEFNGLRAFNPETNNTFDGNNYTVSNWTYNGGANDMAFIKSWVGTIKNVNFDNCNLKTGGRSAVVAANTYCQIDNVHVSNSTLTSTWWACGMIAGLYNHGSVSNCTVTDCSISSTGGVGAIVGVFNETDGVRTITNCEVEGCAITCTNENASEPYYAGAAMVGLINLDYSTIKFINCKQSNNTYNGMFCKDELYGYSFSEVVIE